MPGFEERVYELGREALAEQERQVGEIRSRGSALLAGGAVIAGLLAGPVFADGHPAGTLELSVALAGLAGAGGLLVAVVLLFLPYEMGFSVKAGETYRALWDAQLLEQPAVDLALADAFDERRQLNAKVIRYLVRSLTAALAGLVIETGGLASAAALAS